MDKDNETTDEKQPWWNDGDKIGGMVASWALILVMAVVTAFVVKFIIWLF
jgi:hypothetical protein